MQESVTQKQDIMGQELDLHELVLSPEAISILVETLDLFFKGEAA